MYVCVFKLSLDLNTYVVMHMLDLPILAEITP